MSNIIPPMLSSTPPPVDDQVEEEDDDEFGDFRVADHSLSFADFNQSNDSNGSPEIWMKPFSPSLSLDGDGIIKTPEKIPNGMVTPTTEDDGKQCDSPQHLNVFIQPVSEDSSITNKLPEKELVSEEVQSNQDDISEELKLDGDEDDDLNLPLPQAQENIPDEEVSVSSLNEALNPNEGCDIINTDDFNEEFSDFRTCDEINENNENIESNKSNENEQEDCEFSDFADFTSDTVKEEKDEIVEVVKNESPVPVQSSLVSEDDFDDFECADFKPSKEPSLEETLQMMFPNTQEIQEDVESVSTLTECLHSCLDDSSSVWGQLKELETSHALSYQWSNSSANKCLLSSLNIDSRYVLYGSRWNASIPRFAANLGFSPLEPVKASETPLVPQPAQQPQVQPPTIPASVIEEVVPAAQFDWTSSGLTNPLDCLEKEIIPATASTPEQATQGTITKEETIKNNILSPTVGNSPSSSSPGQSKIPEENSLQSNSSYPKAKVKKKEELSPEAYKVVESFPDLSFLSARKLMCTANENMNRWRPRP